LSTKFNVGSIVESVKKSFKDSPSLLKSIGVGDDLPKLTDADFLKMPAWWQACTQVPGLPYGKMVQIAGDSDSGKTSMAIEAMKAAQQAGACVIYVETEGKTTTKDLADWGVDASQVIIIPNSIAEEAFEMLFSAWDRFREKYPKEKLLIIFDSIGNVVSRRDSTIDLTEQDSKPGGKGKINRLAINKMISKRDSNAAILMINYTYDNIGSMGKTNAGGKALNFFSCLTFQTSRKGWVEKTVKGQKVRVGADVVWKLYKNHLSRGGSNNKEFTLRITSEGIECISAE
jgi:recombination protein RecA